MFLRLPGEAVLEVFEDGLESFGEISFEFIADGDGVNDDLAGGFSLARFWRRSGP